MLKLLLVLGVVGVVLSIAAVVLILRSPGEFTPYLNLLVGVCITTSAGLNFIARKRAIRAEQRREE
ncbi:hypothetical protein B7R21_18600 [Subtercola boreus]|uniref:Uncharacterized protein n=1 Tax=Subtercola boreus TaxID=120213 RepID=A0A3E0VAG3_9MICO|nr:hypothetical protein [Subtercola boreus]RFA06784.1 hypothetical protein B7R21_18600 [Subtercola boreus]